MARADKQLKLRGFRIEAGEIEALLREYPGVEGVVVDAVPASRGDRRLVAYWTASGDDAPTPEELHRHLSSRLPSYMVPASFVRLEALPVTPNGKLDRAALPAPDPSVWDRRPFVPPRTATEEELARIWRDVLGLEQVGIRDDFFGLGGTPSSPLRSSPGCDRPSRWNSPSDLSSRPRPWRGWPP